MSEPEADRVDGAPHPRETATLHGQGAAEAEVLAALAQGRPHHAWMIAGPRGVGKATLAWRIARHMLAGGRGDSLAMEPDHPVFRQTAALGAPRLFLARRSWDEKAKRLRSAITVEEIRAMRTFFQLSSPDGGWRVAIVDAADEMTPQAANALLKTLEEPPERALILLVAHRPASLLPTLRSRCRTLRCAALCDADLARALADAGAAPASEIGMLGALAGGSAGEALRLEAVDGCALFTELAELIAASPMDRRWAIGVAESCAGRASEERYDAAVGLIGLALSRLARTAAGAPSDPLCPAEARAMARLAAHPGQALLWAELAPRLADRAGKARLVHLDPAQVILDMLLQIDMAAAEARAFAA